jgi:hypothetical protein
MNNTTKADIVQRLLDSGSITAVEAVILLTNNTEIKQPTLMPYVDFPWYDWKSNPIFNPTIITCKNKTE